MRNFIFLLLAGSLFVACNNSGDNTSTSTTGATDSTAAQTQNTPAVTPDSASMSMPPEPTPGNASFTFEKTEHDFGKIKQDHPVEYTFNFKNTGTEPLVISEARGSCGCTVPEYSKEPVAVGESGKITVSFDPKGKSGVQRKTVTITANTNPARTTINIVSDVEAPAAPAN